MTEEVTPMVQIQIEPSSSFRPVMKRIDGQSFKLWLPMTYADPVLNGSKGVAGVVRPPTINEPVADKGQAHRRRHLAPRVSYVRLVAIYDAKVRELPPSDQAVARKIAMTGAGTTRAELLKVMKAKKHTGRVDGAVRRLRIKGIIQVANPALA